MRSTSFTLHVPLHVLFRGHALSSIDRLAHLQKSRAYGDTPSLTTPGRRSSYVITPAIQDSKYARFIVIPGAKTHHLLVNGAAAPRGGREGRRSIHEDLLWKCTSQPALY